MIYTVIAILLVLLLSTVAISLLFYDKKDNEQRDKDLVKDLVDNMIISDKNDPNITFLSQAVDKYHDNNNYKFDTVTIEVEKSLENFTEEKNQKLMNRWHKVLTDGEKNGNEKFAEHISYLINRTLEIIYRDTGYRNIIINTNITDKNLENDNLKNKLLTALKIDKEFSDKFFTMDLVPEIYDLPSQFCNEKLSSIEIQNKDYYIKIVSAFFQGVINENSNTERPVYQVYINIKELVDKSNEQSLENETFLKIYLKEKGKDENKPIANAYENPIFIQIKQKEVKDEEDIIVKIKPDGNSKMIETEIIPRSFLKDGFLNIYGAFSGEYIISRMYNLIGSEYEKKKAFVINRDIFLPQSLDDGNRDIQRGEFLYALMRIRFIMIKEISAFDIKNNKFTDIKNNLIETAILTAKEEKITFGTSESKFSPDEKLTQEQLYTFLCRFRDRFDLNYPNLWENPYIENIENGTHGSEDYAKDCIKAMYDAGFIYPNHLASGKFEPKNTVKINEAVEIIYALITQVEKSYSNKETTDSHHQKNDESEGK